MMVVRGTVKLFWCVALRADAITVFVKLSRMRIVTIRTGDSCGVHLALHKRAVIEDLVPLLAIHMIKAAFESCWPERIKQSA